MSRRHAAEKRETNMERQAWYRADRIRREALILRDIGVLAHYVGDGSQPLAGEAVREQDHVHGRSRLAERQPAQVQHSTVGRSRRRRSCREVGVGKNQSIAMPHQGQGAGGISAALEVAGFISRLERAGHTRERDAYAEKKATASTHRLGCAAT